MLRLMTAATVEPVTVADAKLRLRIDGDALDAAIRDMITSAREIVELQTGYALAEASYEWTPVGPIGDLPIQPAVIVSEVGATPIVFRTQPGPAPQALRSAVILLVGDLLANTEASSESQLIENPAFQTLIFPYRRVLP